MRYLLSLLSLVAGVVFSVSPEGELEASDYMRAEQMNAGFLQGDILNPSSEFMERNALRREKSRWPGARIPYTFDPSAGFNVFEQEVLRTARANYDRYTCIKWVPRTANDNDYVNFINGRGCYSSVGRQGGKQDVSLMRPDGNGSCMIPGIGQHEMMHSSGFLHEQSRPDRDDFVTIEWDNIQSGYAINFDRCSMFDCETLGANYDYGSVMHYPNNSFSKDSNLATIVPKKAGAKIGQRRGFSWIDVFKLNAYYGCPVPMNVPGPIDQNINPNVCNFDIDFCGWIQDYKVVLNPNVTDPFLQFADEFDFFRISGSTPSPNTGPNGDHTSGNGRYIYSEASYPAEQGDRFRIRTPSITGNGSMCVTFYYSMYAANSSMMGALNVSTLASTDAEQQLIWSKHGAQQSTPSWSQALVNVTINGAFQVLFEAVRGPDCQGDIAIDDFAVTNGVC